MIDYFGKKIVIVGLGLTGLSCVDFFLKRGVIPRIMDTSLTPSGLSRLPKQIKYHLGSLNENWLLAANLVVVSPGFRLDHPFLIKVINAGIEIIGDIELFCREVQEPIIAITGSNGKSTVTALVGEMAKAASINVGIGGNCGPPALMLLDKTRDLYILELSSFQLETTYSLQAIAATVLNVTENHMDRYPFGLQQYRTAKVRIYKNAKVCVINNNDKLTVPRYAYERFVSFGIEKGDYHLHYQKNNTWLCVKGEKLLNVREMKLSGQHNYTNALAALALADAAKLTRETSLKVLTKFTGLAHRLQLVLKRNGVHWINDSKSTSTSSTKAALNSLQIDGTLYLILGGYGKSANFLTLGRCLKSIKNLQLYCFGRDRAVLAALYPNVAHQTETMEQAMRQIAPQLKSGDTVLLSPACSSLGQFKNFEQRGDIFTLLAEELG